MTKAKPRLKNNDNDPLKVPPHSIEAEQSVLGGLMLDPHAWDQVVDRIKGSDFYRNDHQLIFNVMSELSRQNKAVDTLTVTDSLNTQDNLEKAGGNRYILLLANNIPTTANITAYADIVRDRALLRQILNAANDIANSAFNTDGRSGKELLDAAEQRIFSLAENRPEQGKLTKIDEILAKATDRVDALYKSGGGLTGVASGFVDLDDLTTGFQQGDLILIAGRPSMGKTAFAMNIVENVAINNPKPVLMFSMEMPDEMLAIRMMSSLGRINQRKIRTGQLTSEDWPRITSVVSMLSGVPLFIDDTPALTPFELRTRARRISREQGELGLIVIDYLQLMSVQGRAQNRTMEISEISRSLKILAKELHVPIIALSQLNRGLETREERRPTMSDLRDSGALEQDADLIIFIYRDEVYKPQTPDRGIAEIIIAKQRNGPIGKIRLAFLGEYTRFENYVSNISQPIPSTAKSGKIHETFESSTD